MAVATRSRGGAAGRPKQATLEDFDVGGTTTTTGSSRKAQRARSAAGESKEKKATTVTKSSSSPSAATAANANTTAQPSATTQRVRKRRKADDSAGGDNIDEDPPARPSAADAGAIRGNTTVSPSLPAQSKRRKPNAAGDAKSPRAGRATPKAKSGGRNTGVRAKNAVKEQLHSEGGDTGTVKEEEAEEEQKPVVINRAPVLQLWGACVARVLFRERDVAWKTCLSIGVAIAALCAVSKGKAVGMIEPKDQTDDQAAKKADKKQRALQGAEVYRVMNFPLPVKNGAVLLSGTPKNANEEQLVGKFGGRESYERVKAAMDSALETWQGGEEELDKKAFGMYETFRPNVPPGARGWGRKGELSLAQIDSVVRRA